MINTMLLVGGSFAPSTNQHHRITDLENLTWRLVGGEGAKLRFPAQPSRMILMDQ